MRKTLLFITFMIAVVIGLKPAEILSASIDLCQVRSEQDSGTGSLRQILALGCNQISFTERTSTITLKSELQITKRNITIDGGVSQVTISGGGMTRVFDIEKVKVMFRNVIIRDGKASEGGGIYNEGGTIIIGTGTLIMRNTASDDGGGILNEEGTIIIEEGGVITENTAKDGAGGIGNDQGDVIVNGLVSHNTAKVGGGIGNDHGKITIGKNGKVSGNEAQGQGGGIYNWDGVITGEGRVIENLSLSGECADIYDDSTKSCTTKP